MQQPPKDKPQAAQAPEAASSAGIRGSIQRTTTAHGCMPCCPLFLPPCCPASPHGRETPT
eukprot:354470-Chlamydomonas_euryale.AAC.16